MRLRFKGASYDGHALDAIALRVLVEFQNVVTKTAEAVWKKRNPNLGDIPQEIEERTQLILRTIKEGSTIVPLELSRSSDQLFAFPDRLVEADESVGLIYETFVAANAGTQLPEGMPKEMLQPLAGLGKKSLRTAHVSFAPPHRDLTSVSQHACERLRNMAERPYSDEVEVRGYVLEADVRRRKFQIWMDIDKEISARVNFTEDQESEIITALKEHASLQLLVKGRGKFTSDGRLQEIQEITSLQTIHDDVGIDRNAPRIEDQIARIFSDVPDEEWRKLPTDLSHRHDFYLYGDNEQ